MIRKSPRIEENIKAQQLQKLSFNFYQNRSKIVLHAFEKGKAYSLEFESHPLMTIDDFEKVINTRKIKIISQTNSVLTIKLADLIQLELKSKFIPGLSHIQQTVKELENSLQVEAQKSRNLEKAAESLEGELQQLMKYYGLYRITNMERRDKLIEKKKQLRDLKSQLSLQSIIFDQTYNQIVTKNKNEMHSAEKSTNTKPNSIFSKDLTDTKSFDQWIRQDIEKNKKKLEAIKQEQEKNINSPKFLNQSILVDDSEKENIQNFFHQPLIRAYLIYRASENQFSIQKFHKKCDNIPNTLTLCWTQFDKKIGGFTPLKWRNSYISTIQNDVSRDSFIFSLTHNEKFNLLFQSQAIINHRMSGPTFGTGIDFTILDQANTNDNSFANVGKSYRNEYDDEASCQRFCGNPAQNFFRIKQWQVWALQFSSDH